MIEIDDVIILFIGFCVLVLILINYTKLNSLLESKIIIIAFCFLLISWFFSLIEGLILEDIMNFLQHFFLAINSILVAFYFWKKYKKGDKDF